MGSLQGEFELRFQLKTAPAGMRHARFFVGATSCLQFCDLTIDDPMQNLLHQIVGE